MDNAAAATSEEAAVTIAPAEMVSISRADLAIITRAARLCAALFEGEADPDAIVDEACEAGLTIETDAPEDAEDDVDTYVELAPEFLEALDRAEDAAGA